MKLLFVCSGNICRSPTAEGVFRAEAAVVPGIVKTGAHLYADSAGIGGWHEGEAPDPRSIRHARDRGYDISGLRARQIRPEDFTDFDLILAMDRGHLRDLRKLAPKSALGRIQLYLDFAPSQSLREVPDPYYGGEPDFLLVLDLVAIATKGLIDHIMAR